MRIKVSDYIAKQLVKHGITQVFSVTGGGAMHLNDALGHEKDLHVCISIMSRHVPLRQKAMPEFTIRSELCV